MLEILESSKYEELETIYNFKWRIKFIPVDLGSNLDLCPRVVDYMSASFPRAFPFCARGRVADLKALAEPCSQACSPRGRPSTRAWALLFTASAKLCPPLFSPVHRESRPLPSVPYSLPFAEPGSSTEPRGGNCFQGERGGRRWELACLDSLRLLLRVCKTQDVLCTSHSQIYYRGEACCYA